MTDDQADRLERKIDELLALAPTINALGTILVRQNVASKQKGVANSSISQNKNIEKYVEYGHRRVFVEIGEVGVVRRRK